VTIALGLRLLAAPAAVIAGRSASRPALAFAGLLAGFAAFGVSAVPVPEAAGAALAILGLLALGLAALQAKWLPITGEGALAAALYGAPAAVVAGFAARENGAWVAFASAAIVLAAVSLCASESVRAAAEAGIRRVLLLAWAFLLPPLLVSFAAGAVRRAPRDAAAFVLAISIAVSLLVWLPAILVERRRVARELHEEVRLGLLPLEDAAALELPWRRAFEKRFGRPDERREYVRSALLLAVARAQQRRRSGEAERLRQLEILTFRTRLRRTLEARAARYGHEESGEIPALPIDR
jgi:hypothetical protein